MPLLRRASARFSFRVANACLHGLRQGGSETRVERDMTNQIEPEKRLWCSVINVALSDAVLRKNLKSRDSSQNSRNNQIQEARSWFLNKSQDFNLVVSLAGFDPDVIRSHALRLIRRAQAEEIDSIRLRRGGDDNGA